MSLRSGRSVVICLSALISFSQNTSAHVHLEEDFVRKPVLASIADLQRLNIPILAQDSVSQVGFAYLTPHTQVLLQEQSHQLGKCGGFEALPETSRGVQDYVQKLEELKSITLKHQAWQRLPWQPLGLQAPRESIMEAASLVQETNIQETVTWLSSFKNRHHREPEGSAHIYQMKTQIEQMLKSRTSPWSVDIISHSNTGQKSLRARLTGSTRPNEIIVVGGHHDSINHSWSGGRDKAPGADDNASGSANVLEILRVLSEQKQTARTIEFMWYAAEEAGLLGSAEIAKTYKQEKKDVVAVMQLDMTLYPGSGEMVITNITDFTHPWLQELMKQVNERYVGLKILDDKCGYGCSDHASWHRQGFATVLPFEAMSAKMNPNIHTAKDVISPALSFKHSAAIAKLALAWTMELADSDIRPPSM